jgi:polysaccharide biosynthesis/export protein
MKRYFLFVIIVFAIVLSSCSSWLTPYRMYKVDKSTVISPSEELFLVNEHLISADDELSLSVFANNAELLISPEVQSSNSSAQQALTFRVQKNGTVFLPALGPVNLQGKSISEAEELLRREYRKFVNEPFVALNVVKKTVCVHKGGKNGAASYIELKNCNSTLIDALTAAGGIADGKSNKIFLIRGKEESLKIYHLSMSDAENAKYGNVVLQSNDVIYIVPQPFVSRRLLEDITPVLSLATTVLLIINLLK